MRVGAQVQAMPRCATARQWLNPTDSRPFIHVVAGVVIDAADRVLIAQRPSGKHMAGGWEFPGGKLEPGEERLAGLARELREELGITLIGNPRPLIRVRHDYPSREVLLDVWVVKRFSGEPRGLDRQALRWCTRDELEAAELLPADRPIVAALRLPERLMLVSTADYLIVDPGSTPTSPKTKDVTHDTRLKGTFCASAEQAPGAAAAGTDFIVMRVPVTSGELAALCQVVPVPVYAREVELEAAWVLGASGANEIDD
jgi:mutator protein MutT